MKGKEIHISSNLPLKLGQTLNWELHKDWLGVRAIYTYKLDSITLEAKLKPRTELR